MEGSLFEVQAPQHHPDCVGVALQSFLGRTLTKVVEAVLAILIVGCAVLGLVVGSFLNVVIYRVPRHESIISPRSRCTTCGEPIRGRDNVPVLSWIALRGKCRNCGAPISMRYPLVEFATALFFAGAAARMGWNWELPSFLVMFAGLFALACIDTEKLVLPLEIVYTTFLLMVALFVLASAIEHDWHHLLVGAVGAAAWYMLFFVLNLASPKILGFGDVRLALVLGLGLGWLGWRYVVLGFFAANLVGAVIGITLIAIGKVRRDQPIPYGVFLALGAGVAIYAGPELLAPFQTFHL